MVGGLQNSHDVHLKRSVSFVRSILCISLQRGLGVGWPAFTDLGDFLFFSKRRAMDSAAMARRAKPGQTFIRVYRGVRGAPREKEKTVRFVVKLLLSHSSFKSFFQHCAFTFRA